MSILEKDIADLVRTITKRAKDKDTPFCEAIDALKAITAYTVALRRLASGRADSDDDDGTFNSFRQDIDEANERVPAPVFEETSNGAAATVRGRRGRQPS